MQRQIYDKVELFLNEVMKEYTDLLTYLMNKENTREIFSNLYRDKFAYVPKVYLNLTNELPQTEGELLDLVQGISKRLYITNLGWKPKDSEVSYKFMTWLLDGANKNLLKEKYLHMMNKEYPVQEIKNRFVKEMQYKKGPCF